MLEDLMVELNPKKKEIDKVLIDIAQSNGLSLKELMDFEEFYFIEKEIYEKLSILNLQRFITKDLKVSKQQIIKVCSEKKLRLATVR